MTELQPVDDDVQSHDRPSKTSVNGQNTCFCIPKMMRVNHIACHGVFSQLHTDLWSPSLLEQATCVLHGYLRPAGGITQLWLKRHV